MEPKKETPGPEKPAALDPFITKAERPDLTVVLDTKLGDLTVRDIQELLGGGSSPAISKQFIADKPDITDKNVAKDVKDIRDNKGNKDHKEPKDTKDGKENKDHKDPKDSKDQKDSKDTKDPKDSKDSKDTKDSKDPKEQNDHKAVKDHKDTKEHKDIKDHKEGKEGFIEKFQPERQPEINRGPSPEATEAAASPSSLEALIERLTGLEKEVRDLKQSGRGGGAGH